MTKDNKKGTKPPKHWSQYIHEIVVSPTDDGSPNFTVRGGAENGLFPYIADVRSDRILVRSGKLHTDDLLIELNGHKLPGFTLWDIEALLAHIGRAPLHLKTVKQGQTLNKDLRRYLNMRFQKGSVDHDLQQTIRENLYVRTVPCTTRAPREGEVDGVDYKFLSVDEFMALEKSGHLLESGVFDGNHYGTPKPPAKPPPAQSPTSSSSPPPPVQHPQQNNSSSTSPKRSAVHRPGAKPSAPGKRQRNKSTIEATTLNSDPLDEEEQRRREEIQRAEEELGDLPLNWEIAFTDQGDMYFINHVTETTQWLDPRLEHKPIKDLLDCDDDELPYGWEKIDDPQFGTYYIDHINRKTQYANPVLQAKEEARKNDTNKSDGRYPMTLPRSARSSQSSLQAPAPSRALSDPNMQENGHSARPQLSTSPIKTTSDAEWRAMFTNDPDKLKGQTIKTVLKKSKRGFGFTIVGGDDCEEFLQIKSVVPTGPAASDGILKTGDVLVFVKSDATPEPVKVLGYTHQQVVTLFQAIMPGEQVHLEVCRGYPLPFDPDDPNTHIVTSYAISPSSNLPGVKIPGTPSSSAFRKHNSMPSDKIHNNIGPPSYKDTNMTHAASRHQHENRDTPPPPPKISSGHHRNHRNGDSGSNLSREAHVKSLPDLTAAKPQEMEVTGSPRAKTPTLSSNHKPDSLTLPNNVNSRGSVSSEHPSESPSSTQPEIHAIQFVKGNQGFGFTVADSPYGQKVKQILAPANCKTLREGDILVEINGEYIRYLPHNQVVHKLKECPLGVETTIVVQRGGMLKPVRNPNKIKPVKTPKTPEPRDKNEGPNLNEFRTSEDRDNVNHRPHSNGPYRGDSYSSDEYDSRDEDQGMRHHRHGRERVSKSPRTVKREETYDHEERHRDHEREKGKGEPRHHYRDQDRIPNENGPIHGHHSDHRPHADHDSDRSWDKEVDRKANDHGNRRGDPRRQHERNDRRLAENERRSTERDRRPNRDPNRRRDDPDRPVVDYETRSLERKRRPRSPEHDRPVSRPERSRTPKYDYDSRENRPPPKSPGMERQGHPLIENGTKSLRRDQRGHPEDGRGQEGRRSRPGGESGTGPRSRTPKPHHSTSPVNRSDDVIGQRPPSRAKQPAKAPVGNNEDNFIETTVFLKKLDNGFGFRIVGGREEQSQVAIGNIVPNGAADLDGRLVTGDELLYIDGQSVIGSSHQEVVNLMVKASLAGRVSLGIRRKISPSASEPMGKNPVDRRPFSEPPPPNSPSSPTRPNAVTFPYDVTIHRRASEGFGLVILSSTLTSGSKIGRIIKGSPTDRCGKVKVGDRLIAVNKVDIMNMHHKDIVNMIKDAGLSVTLTIGPPEDPVAGNSPKAHDSMTNALAMPAHIKSSDTSLLPRDSFREGPQSPVTPTADLYSHQHEPQYPTAQRWRPPSVPVRADNRDHVSSSRSTPQPNYNQRSPTSYNPHPYQQHQQSSVPYSESSRDTYTRSADYPTEPYPTDRHPHQYPQPVDSYPAPHHPQHQHAAYRRTQEPSMPPNHGMFDDQPEIEPGDYYAVDLERGTMGFGFSIRGGREFQNTPLFVLRMAEEGPAARNGLVRVGDQIIEINGHSTDGMLHSEAIDVIRRGGNRVRLLLRRAGPPPASDGAREGMFKTGSNSSLRSADQAFYKHHYPDHHHQSKGSSHQVEPFDSWSYRSLPRGMRY